jgi:hypothetical protein
MSTGVTFSPSAAAKIQRATHRVLNTPPSRTGDRTQSVGTESMFWGLILGSDPSGLYYTFLRVIPSCVADSSTDFRLTNGTAYRIYDAEDMRAGGIAREANGNKTVPTYTVALLCFIGFDADDQPAFLFQHGFDPSQVILPPHDHRDNYNGGFAFACWHPGTSLPQQPWAM